MLGIGRFLILCYATLFLYKVCRTVLASAQVTPLTKPQPEVDE